LDQAKLETITRNTQGKKTMLTLNDLFDESYYLARNPDVAAGVANGA